MTLEKITIRTSLHGKHVGNFIRTIFMMEIIRNMRVDSLNTILGDFGCCDSSTAFNIHITFLWNYMAVNYGT